ncbi:MAG: TetR/AcrR family transcriptional regulator [Reyranellaceae bacterium]
MADTPRRRGQTGDTPAKVDGRFLRTERTRQRIIEAVLALLQQGKDPTANEIADHAGCSVRSVFERFHDMVALRTAAADYALAEVITTAPTSADQTDRPGRVGSHIALHAGTCEQIMALWRTLLVHQDESEHLRQRIVEARASAQVRTELAFAPELESLPPERRHERLMVIESLLDFDQWLLMREHHGLSFDESCEVWIAAVDRLLP